MCKLMEAMPTLLVNMLCDIVLFTLSNEQLEHIVRGRDTQKLSPTN